MQDSGAIVNLAELSSLIASLDDVLIVTHERPDGDAIGSVLGMLTCLLEKGRRADVYFPESLPASYQWFVRRPIHVSLPPKDLSYTTVVCLDCGSEKRMVWCEELKGALKQARIVNIDHHPDNTRFGRLNYVDSAACSTAEILYRAIAGTPPVLPLSAESATDFLLGVVMDTGGFRFDNTTASTLTLAASMVDAGADYHGIVKKMFLSKPMNYFRLLSDIGFRQMRLACDGKLAFLYLSEELLKAYGVDLRDTEGVIDHLRGLEGVEVAVMVVRRTDGFKVSMRSNNPRLSVGQVARKYEGGGHELAAGCQINAESAEQVFDIVVKEFEPVLLSFPPDEKMKMR